MFFSPFFPVGYLFFLLLFFTLLSSSGDFCPSTFFFFFCSAVGLSPAFFFKLALSFCYFFLTLTIWFFLMLDSPKKNSTTSANAYMLRQLPLPFPVSLVLVPTYSCITRFCDNRYSRLAGKLAGGDDGAAFPNADRALFQAINSAKGAAEQAKRWGNLKGELSPNVTVGLFNGLFRCLRRIWLR